MMYINMYKTVINTTVFVFQTQATSLSLTDTGGVGHREYKFFFEYNGVHS